MTYTVYINGRDVIAFTKKANAESWARNYNENWNDGSDNVTIKVSA